MRILGTKGFLIQYAVEITLIYKNIIRNEIIFSDFYTQIYFCQLQQIYRLIRLLSTWCHARHFSCPIYTVFIVNAYQISQYVVPRDGIFFRQVAQLFRRKFRR
jgi:hypothetical protein